MANETLGMIGKYLAIGAGAVGVPALVGGIGGIGAALANIPMWGTAIYGTGASAITIGGIVLAGLGAGLVDQLFFSK